MNKTRNWILIADSSRATLLETNALLGDWRVVDELEHPRSRMKDSELTTDGRGRTSPRNRAASRRAAMTPTTSPQEVEVEKFSRELAELLRLSLARNEYDSAMLVAPPHFLGLLRGAICSVVHDVVRVELDKNLTKERPEAVIAALRACA